MGHSPVPVPSGQSFCLSRGCPSVRGWWRRDPGWWRRPLHKELPEGAAPSSQTGPGLLYEGDLCAELCLQALPQLLYRVEEGRFKFLGEILERAGPEGGRERTPPPPPNLPYLLSFHTVHGVLTPRSNSPLYGKEIKPVSPKGSQS